MNRSLFWKMFAAATVVQIVGTGALMLLTQSAGDSFGHPYVSVLGYWYFIPGWLTFHDGTGPDDPITLNVPVLVITSILQILILSALISAYLAGLS